MSQSKHPVISIVIPVYNTEKYLEKCVSSILEQTFHDFEVILVDDGSQDASPELCDNFAKKHSQVSVIHQKNAGQTAARKAGLKKAKGEYALLVDADDWLEANALEVLHDNAISSKADIVTCNMYFHTNGRRQAVNQPVPKGVFDQNSLSQYIYPVMIYSGRFFYFGIAAAMWNKLFKTSLLIANLNAVDEKIQIGEDGLTTYGAFLDAKRIAIIDDHLYNYRNDNASITRTYTKNQFTNAQKLIAALRTLNRQKDRYDLSSQIDYYYMYNIWSIFEEEFRFKTNRSWSTKYSYLAQIARHPSVIATAKRVPLTGMRWRHRRFLWLLGREQVVLLIVTTYASVRLRAAVQQVKRLVR